MKRQALWLDDNELRWLNRLAAAAVPVFVLLYQPWLEDDHNSRLVLTGFGIGFAAALWIAGRMRHRLWAAFASFLMGLFGPWSFAYIVGLLYIGYAFWVLSHARRALREPPTPT